MSASCILIVDDETQIRRFLRIALEAHGFAIVEAVRGEDGVAKCATEHPDLVVLDLGLPDIDGQAVVRRIREWSQVPILVLSVRQDEAEKVAALDAGANDYVTKPFGIAELLARIRVLLRSRPEGMVSSATAELRIGGLTVNAATHEVSLDGQAIRLTRKEFELLNYLAAHAGRIVTHRMLLTELWGPAHADDVQYLRVFIGRLRGKLGDDPTSPRFILNEPGVGYRFLVE
ncbi:response regulator transcription factor [Consotaella aegiceratis]|uniref:response regulator transcription factor n=1 Tax=Consotaella aegiceratis TaxID=3097961 RepID=UPI002F4023F1